VFGLELRCGRDPDDEHGSVWRLTPESRARARAIVAVADGRAMDLGDLPRLNKHHHGKITMQYIILCELADAGKITSRWLNERGSAR